MYKWLIRLEILEPRNFSLTRDHKHSIGLQNSMICVIFYRLGRKTLDNHSVTKYMPD